MQTINSESYENSNLVTDLDNFRGRNLETNFSSGLAVIYPSCEIYTFEQNLFRLIAESKAEPFRPKWTMRPDYTSFDMYRSVVHWALILFVNDVYSIEDYKGLSTVLIPPVDLIVEMIRERVPKWELQHLDKFMPVTGISMFQRKPFDAYEKNKMVAKEAMDAADGQIPKESVPVILPEPVMAEFVDQFTLEDDDITNKYVDLSGLPINSSSLSLYVGNFTVPQKYGYDYVLMHDANRLIKRISWSPSNCFNGQSNLSNLLKSGVSIKVKYLQLKAEA